MAGKINRQTGNSLYDLLFARYGERRWWPAESPYEVMAGAILTQNTAWTNVEKAIARFEGRLSPQFVLSADAGDLMEIIRPAGFFNRKAGCLKTLTAWYGQYGFAVPSVRAQPVQKIRGELLALRGIGKKTADSILLYAFEFPIFVVDAYTLRLLKRLEDSEEARSYDEAQALFGADLDAALYNNAHALIVENAKTHCRAKPVCEGCPLAGICKTAAKTV
ncbi:MAG: endonuclease [Clostridiales Family XIII bacterium]|jgi:endonuclease-3 related protein|nr:endonuclease [Clostridiales Family XIII bacterium]